MQYQAYYNLLYRYGASIALSITLIHKSHREVEANPSQLQEIDGAYPRQVDMLSQG